MGMEEENLEHGGDQSIKLLRNKMLVLLLVTGFTWSPFIQGEVYDAEGPQFTQEPSRTNYFTNVQGLMLACDAKGSPRPQVQWIGQDGQSVLNYSGIREIFPNGTIYFPPFPVSFYRPDVHDQVYVCIAWNSVGKVRSRDVQVRAVINQRYEVHVEDVYVTEGGDALFKCSIPEAVKDFVSVTSWTKDTSLNIFPHSGQGGRYFMTPSGELLIEEVTRNDSSSTFRCRTVNRLTGETQLSENSARLQVSGGFGSKSKSDSPPSIKSRLSKLKLKEGEVAVLLCLSEGWPPPSQWWMKSSSMYGLESLRPTERIRIRKSAVIIENVGVQDAGMYSCYANNSAGVDRYQMDVVVKTPLNVQVVPPVMTVDIGKSAEFTCWTNSLEDDVSGGGGPMMTGRTIMWRKDGIEIRTGSKLSLSMSGDKLRIINVQREDKGIYQCFVRADSDMSQGASELRLGDAAPQLIYRFIEQTLRPGPAVSLKCSAAGNPTPRILWTLDGFDLPHSERILIGQYVTLNGDVVSHVNITSTRVEDGGEFKCVASNKVGTSGHSARLNIYGPTSVRNMPSTITAVAGKDFRIKCPVAGYPISSITWEKDGQALPLTRRQLVSTDGSLTVRDVDRVADSGWYACSSHNKQGNSDRKGFQLSVVVPPKIETFTFPVGAKEGSKVVGMCTASGDVPMRMQWLKDDEVVGDTNNSNNNNAEGVKKVKKFSSDIITHRILDDDAFYLQITHVSPYDAGNWTCAAINAAGKVTQTTQLVVQVPPKIAPFSFPAQVSQGSRVQAVCSVEQGDVEETNLTVTWLKDSEPLLGTGPRVPLSIPATRTSATASSGGNNFVRIVHVDAYSAMLIIDRVDSAHSGNYTCKISNSVSTVSHSSTLIVRVPPKWTIEPKETEIMEGSPVIISCQADGFPLPSISWKKGMGNHPENYRDIPVRSGGSSITMSGGSGNGNSGMDSSSEDAFSLLNGTLIIGSAKKVHQGSYLCEATNGVGAGLSKVIKLLVNVPVHVKESQQNFTSRVGGKATLRCEISGDLPILEVGWKRGLVEIKPETDFRYHIRTLNNSQGTFTDMTINNVVREDTARYLCSAANQHGRSQGSVWLYVQEPPDTPRNLHVISKASRFVRLGWILTQDGNSPITQFIVKYKHDSALSHEYNEITVPPQVFSETVGNLKPSKKYLFTVVAENHVGQSEGSEVLEVRMEGEAPEGGPKNVKVAAVTCQEIQITWDHPLRDSWNGELLGYYVGYRRFREDGEQYQFNTVERRDGLQEYQIKGLQAFTSYEIVIQAYNGVGAGPFSEALVATTLEDVPTTPPDGLHCSPLTSHNLQLGWNPLSGEQARGIIKGYKVGLERADFDLVDPMSGGDVPLVKTSQSTNLVISGLSKYTNYSVVVHAFTAAGEGPVSNPIFCHTEEDVPGSPSAIKTTVSSPSSIIVTWLPPAELNGILTKYTLYLVTAETGKGKDVIKRKRQVSPDTTKFQFDGLRTDEKYEVKVTASTRVGEGGHIMSTRILSKSNLQSAITTFGLDFRIVWKKDVRLPCETVGNPRVQWTRYTETVKDTDRISVTSSDGTLLIRSARREDSGNYTCTINNDKGHIVDSITHRVIVQVPPLGPLLNAAVNSHSSLNLGWKLSDSGNGPIRGYILHLKAGDEWSERQLNRHLTSYELKDLECGSPYQMYLAAYSRAGMGRASETVNVSTLGYPPSLSLVAPQFMVETNQTWARVLLHDVWSPNGCPIRKFQVLYRESEASHWHSAVVGPELGGESHSVDLLGLKAGSNYQVRVIATNSAGSGSAEVVINTPSSHAVEADASNTLSNYSSELTPFYLDMKLMLPITFAFFIVLLAGTGVCLCLVKSKKTPISYRSTDHLSIGTSSSSTYFKQNQRHHANAQQAGPQVYMTVKKSTPLKGVDVTDLEPIPQFSDDIYPYATFQLNENRGNSKITAITTLDRRKQSGSEMPWSQSAMYQEGNRSKGPKSSRTSIKQDEESDEYDTYGSDTDTERGEEPHHHHLHHRGANRSSIHNNGSSSAVGPNRLNSKFQEYDSHARHGNRYEFAPPSAGGGFLKSRPMQNEILGMVMADPYSFNDAFPTVEDRKRRTRRRSHGNAQQGQFGTEFNGLDPPSGFKDTTVDKNRTKSRRSGSATEYGIAV